MEGTMLINLIHAGEGLHVHWEIVVAAIVIAASVLIIRRRMRA
jgi:hypothetical protein